VCDWYSITDQPKKVDTFTSDMLDIFDKNNKHLRGSFMKLQVSQLNMK